MKNYNLTGLYEHARAQQERKPRRTRQGSRVLAGPSVLVPHVNVKCEHNIVGACPWCAESRKGGEK